MITTLSPLYDYIPYLEHFDPHSQLQQAQHSALRSQTGKVVFEKYSVVNHNEQNIIQLKGGGI